MKKRFTNEIEKEGCLGKKVTFIIIPDIASNPRYLQVSKRLIIGLCISCLCIALLIGSLFFHYITLWRRSSDVARLTNENHKQKENIYQLTKKVESLSERLDKIHTSNNKLQVLAGIKKSEKIKQVFGTGGGIADGMYEFSKTNLSRLAEQMNEELENMEVEVSDEEENVLKMTDLIEERKSILDSTPSLWPANGWLTSTFGYRTSPFTGKKLMHYGIDIAARRETPIVSPARGIVTFSGTKGNYGKVVIISHGYGFTTMFGHNTANLVKVGDKVERGDVIAYLGSTGRSTAPHLHYEVRVEGIPTNPIDYMLD
jgi:murein DD-endopeptidase MepM/ murein hydrolase activator NlpD